MTDTPTTTPTADTAEISEAGQLLKIYRVRCGAPDCNETQIVGYHTQREAERVLRFLGWWQDETYGWVCVGHDDGRPR